ncbi:CDP-alcohol phosphatidyltransferase family protein [Staphylococcus agnetis]|uniref:CDP-alcohol phosphatidyltransferase family protein n=1 Tax=Staphylococcus agnetis TaxID=985762 RepID=UPI0018D7938F|nr:CDP-alcohol phosphatidyltransferase family protein [Staphylococcus agnetis]MBY7663534.1 CDP-alcohol phosphatidyltransferase family protein [Staphylococcus agnetis]MCO4326103.1 CDP-alcohol phosphatidyltransferase family protein [Staphylococcus agnetis]MCO4369345.1 CDP-alcohol phosphatidyltransferase family protein [Staphylococcus agnetis]
MISIYELKPKFQQLLMPIVDTLRKKGITPNQVTLSALILSILTGGLIAALNEQRWIYLLVPIVMFVRMALNAVDGVMASKYHMKSNLGMLLNELGDVVSDLALFLPFVFVVHDKGISVIMFIGFAVISEMAGSLVQVIGSKRRYDGPMGKSDRAFLIGLLSFLIAVNVPVLPLMHIILYIATLLILVNIYKRVSNGLKGATYEPQ